MKQFFTLITSLILGHGAFAQMSINNPENWWGQTEASIENVDFEVKTVGLFSEVSIAFDVYASEPEQYNPESQLEFVYDFRCEKDAVFNDSWLWIEEYISLGEIYERNEGTAIYEEIVNRRQDPSILTKVSSSEYNLKIYPLFADSTRRVRLSYLVPLVYDRESLSTTLPMQFLDDSAIYPENISLTVHDDTNWYHTRPSAQQWSISENGNGFVKYQFDNGISQQTDIKYESDFPSTNVYFGTYEEEDEQYFQLLYYPEITVEETPSYHMLLLDFDSQTTYLEKDEFLFESRRAILELNDYDFFIMAYSDFTTNFTSEDWQLASEENIEAAFTKIEQDNISPYAKLSSILPAALDRINMLGRDARLNIISSSVEFSEEEFATPYIDEVIEFNNNLTAEVLISVVDVATSKPWSVINNEWLRGNDYFYEVITSITQGSHYNFLEGDDYRDGLSSCFTSKIAFTQEYDFDIELTNGFTYGTYFNNLDNDNLILNKPIAAMVNILAKVIFLYNYKAFITAKYFLKNLLSIPIMHLCWTTKQNLFGMLSI